MPRGKKNQQDPTASINTTQSKLSVDAKDAELLGGAASEPLVASTSSTASMEAEAAFDADTNDPELLRKHIKELQAKLEEAQKSSVQVHKETPGDWWWKCTKCRHGAKAKVFCTECPKGKQYFCHKCCALEHDWDLKTRFHSMEAINPKQNASLIFAVMDALFLPLFVLFVIRQAGIPEGYNDGVDVCPIVDKARELIFRFDAGISLYTKYTLTPICNLEDGYIRLWLDVFVRGIATDTDSFFLLAATIFRARLYHYFFIKTVVMPIAVMFQAIFTTVLYCFTRSLPNLDDSTMFKPFKKLVTKLVDRIQKPSSRLPNTLWRSRPSMQYKDYFTYVFKSHLPRQYRWFSESANNRLCAFSGLLFCIPIAMRTCTIFLRMGWLFHGIAEKILPSSFWHSPNIDFAQVTKDEYTGVMLESLFKGSVHHAGRFAQGHLMYVVDHVPNVTQYTVTNAPSAVVWLVAFLQTNVVLLGTALWEQRIVLGGLLLVFGIVSAVRLQITHLLWSKPNKRFHKLAADEIKAPLTSYRCRVKWMPLLDEQAPSWNTFRDS